jgi:hypothetical protein
MTKTPIKLLAHGLRDGQEILNLFKGKGITEEMDTIW